MAAEDQPGGERANDAEHDEEINGESEQAERE